MGRLLHALLLGVVGALLVHIATLFLIPVFADNDAWARLSKAADTDTFFLIDPQSEAGASMRMYDPFFVTAACRFSLADGPVLLTGAGAPDFWSLSVYNRKGENLFSINDRIPNDEKLNVTVATPLQLIEFQNNMPDELATSVFAEADVDEGFVILRVFVPEASRRGEAEDFITAASCSQIDLGN